MIRSTFATFTTAQSALMASQWGIDVAGQNLANINTEGYTRQRVDLTSIAASSSTKATTTFSTSAGQGVMSHGIIQIRDPFLDMQFRNELVSLGTTDAMDGVLEEIGNIFDETDSTAIRAAFNDIISQLTTMANTHTTSDSSIDAVVRSSFSVLLNAISQNADALAQIEEDMVTKLQDSNVPDINGILESISLLNSTIKHSQVLNKPTLELEDQRNVLLDELAQFLPIEVKYIDDPNPTIDAPTMELTFTDADGVEHMLINDDEFGSMAMGGTESPYSMSVTDTAGTTTDVTDKLVDGVLKGSLDMLNKAGEFDGSDVRGIPYYEKMFDAFVSQMATTMNELNAERDAAGNPIDGTNVLFDTLDGSGVFTAQNIKISDAWAKSEVIINRSHAEGAGGTDTSTAYDNVLKMISALQTDEYDFGYTDATGAFISVFKGSIQGAYDNIQNVQAVDRKATSSRLDTQLTLVSQIQDSRDSISAVNQDEEVMDLMKYQSSYNAASRLVTVLDEMLDKLINQTGVVGR